jgi:two-component system chemotaxis response regulator CheY
MTQILVVDDSPTIRRMVRAALGAVTPPVEFIEAASGLEAIERLALGVVDLIVLDLNMPDMHGLEVIGFVRAHQKYRHVPILVLTTRGDDQSRQAALQAGANAYLTKPFAPQGLATEAAALLPPVARPEASPR